MTYFDAVGPGPEIWGLGVVSRDGRNAEAHLLVSSRTGLLCRRAYSLLVAGRNAGAVLRRGGWRTPPTPTGGARGWFQMWELWLLNADGSGNPLRLTDDRIFESYVSWWAPDLFTNVPRGFWAYCAINTCYRASLVTGYPDGSYQPGTVVPTIRWRSTFHAPWPGADANVPVGPGEPSFPDVPADYWAYKYIEYAKDQGVVQGYADGTYQSAAELSPRPDGRLLGPGALNGGDANVPSGPATASFPDVPTDFWAYRHVEDLKAAASPAATPTATTIPSTCAPTTRWPCLSPVLSTCRCSGSDRSRGAGRRSEASLGVERSLNALPKLGRGGRSEVSEISFGCWTMGGLNWVNGSPNGWADPDEEEIVAGIRVGLDAGVNHFDNADVYGNGRAERMSARAVHRLGVKSTDLILATKVGYFPGTAEHAYEPVHIRHQCEQSLINLRREYLDLYYFHHGDFGENDRYLAGAVEMMNRLVAEGKVRYVGLSAYSVADFVRLVPTVKPHVLQGAANALHDESHSHRLAGTGTHGTARTRPRRFSPLGRGRLLNKYDPARPPQFEPGDSRRDNEGFTADAGPPKPKLDKLATRFGGSAEQLAAVALQYVLAHPRVACVIPGFRNPKQAAINVAAEKFTLCEEDLAFLRETLQS